MNAFTYTLAHVKWFTQVEGVPPEPLGRVLSPYFLGALLLTVLVALLLTRLNVPLQELPVVIRLHRALERLKPYTPWIIRVGMAVPLLAAGYNGYLLHYELGPIPPWLKIMQMLLGVAILIPGADRVAAFGVIALILPGAQLFGLHALIDYVAWVGTAFYLLSRGTRAESAAVPAMYITTGVSLAWAAVEKWVYPAMALGIITEHQIPTFGFPPDLFLMLAGWVELGVAYLLITGVLNRFLSLVVTGLFVLTSMVFGATEILGHWQLHAVLIAFLVEGTGPLPTPVLWHRSQRLQLAFVGVTLIPFVAVLLGLYYGLA